MPKPEPPAEPSDELVNWFRYLRDNAPTSLSKEPELMLAALAASYSFDPRSEIDFEIGFWAGLAYGLKMSNAENDAKK